MITSGRSAPSEAPAPTPAQRVGRAGEDREHTGGWYIDIRDVYQSGEIKECVGRFLCPEGRVLVGRGHRGDENGSTWYYYARLEVVTPDGRYPTTVGKATWSDPLRESRSDFTAPEGTVLVGRRHQGDENGSTEYAWAAVSVTVDGSEYPLKFGDITTSDEPWKESVFDEKAPTGRVMVGRKHEGDETGYTSHRYAVPTV